MPAILLKNLSTAGKSGGSRMDNINKQMRKEPDELKVLISGMTKI